VNGSPAPGKSSGQAIEAMERISQDLLPEGFAYEWSGQILEELKSAGAATVVFALAIIMVYLFLVAQYESWSLPFVVILCAAGVRLEEAGEVEQVLDGIRRPGRVNNRRGKMLDELGLSLWERGFFHSRSPNAEWGRVLSRRSKRWRNCRPCRRDRRVPGGWRRPAPGLREHLVCHPSPSPTNGEGVACFRRRDRRHGAERPQRRT